MGRSRSTSTMAFLTFRTGLSAGLIIGLAGSTPAGEELAGEVGHIRVASGRPARCLGAGSTCRRSYSSGRIRRLAIERVRAAWAHGQRVDSCPDEAALAALDVPALAAAARRGDPLAAGVFRTSGEFLGQGIAILADIDPEVVVVGGIYGRCLDLWQARRSRCSRPSRSRPRGARPLPAQLGEAIGDWSALAVALMPSPGRSLSR
ncbi:MAG: ROK family protein [Chloroflexota bacterium]